MHILYMFMSFRQFRYWHLSLISAVDIKHNEVLLIMDLSLEKSLAALWYKVS